MNTKTEKNDWLNEFLARKQEMLVSGHPSFSKKIGLPDSFTATFRIIGNRNIGYELYLVIETSNFTDKLPDATNLRNQILSFFPEKTNLEILLFLPEQEGAEITPAKKFAVLNQEECYDEFDSQGLLGYFCEKNSEYSLKAGAKKTINSSTNDSFQQWTRENLSKYLSITDLDVFDSGNRVVYELKRVKEDLRDWKPYTDDVGQYNALKNVASMMSAEFLVLAYSLKEINLVSLHQLIECRSDAINGRSQMLKVDSGFSSIEDQEYKSYTSNRWRQK